MKFLNQVFVVGSISIYWTFYGVLSYATHVDSIPVLPAAAILAFAVTGIHIDIRLYAAKYERRLLQLRCAGIHVIHNISAQIHVVCCSHI